ncbi:hypothetical protein DLAC_09358 [Tieghemostelium lacteum]|uniref:26S proteasome non-ATPase regulatory subunit 5 n=1 Tax=Tieghemostelium lacteum TaxID=361077 RepID=A0A151Z9U2_TIELA|nr:hypothetical protein DLAC_09358 [Tieghemostelium lacteum]|eukprot:KYQ90721.1 hypothetical protein DLAC_09358 [Tieghemostelium lacteum]
MDNIIETFDRLKLSTTEEQIEDICFEIRSYLSRDASFVLKSELIPYIGLGLDIKTHSEVNYTTLLQFNVLVQEKATDVLKYLLSTEYIYKLVDLLASPNLKIAVMVMGILKKLLLIPVEGEKFMLSTQFSNYFTEFYQKHSKESTEVQFRCFDIAAIILSKDNKSLIQKYNPFLMMISDTFEKTSDELIQMNVIEIISTICLQTQGLLLVKNIGIFENFNKRLLETIKIAEDTQVDINTLPLPLLNKIINFVGSVSSISNENTQILFQNDFMKVFEYHLENHHQNTLSKYFLNSIITALGNMGVNNKGLDMILQQPQIMKDYMELILSNDHQISTSVMISFSIMLHNKDPLNIVSEKLYQIYQTIPSELLSQRLLKNLTSPQEEVKKANFSLLTSLCIHSWGVEDVIKIPGFYEYLIGHFNETNKIYREWKFKIIQNIVDNHQELFKTSPEKISQFHQLTNYLRRGPHYIETESRVDYATVP